MTAVDKKIIIRLEQIAEELPERERQQLLELTANWRQDSRRARRETYTELVRFHSEHGIHYGHVKDINVGGCFIECRGVFQAGEHVKFSLTFISSPNPIKLNGVIVRRTARGIGIRFENVSPSQIKELESVIAKHTQIIGQRSA